MFVRGKVVKLEFEVPNSEPLRFFAFVNDVFDLLEGEVAEAKVFLDRMIRE